MGKLIEAQEKLTRKALAKVKDPATRRGMAVTAAASAGGTAGNMLAESDPSPYTQYLQNQNGSHTPGGLLVIKDSISHIADAIQSRDPSALIGYHPEMDRVLRDAAGNFHHVITTNPQLMHYHTAKEYAGALLIVGATAAWFRLQRRRQGETP